MFWFILTSFLLHVHYNVSDKKQICMHLRVDAQWSPKHLQESDIWNLNIEINKEYKSTYLGIFNILKQRNITLIIIIIIIIICRYIFHTNCYADHIICQENVCIKYEKWRTEAFSVLDGLSLQYSVIVNKN